MKVLFYQYAKCDTCRKAAKFLKARGISAEVREIVDTPPSLAELERMAGYAGGVRKLFNTAGQVYRELGLSEKLPTLADSQALKLLASHGKLIKRPFVLWEKGGLVGFQEAVWKNEFNSLLKKDCQDLRGGL